MNSEIRSATAEQSDKRKQKNIAHKSLHLKCNKYYKNSSKEKQIFRLQFNLLLYPDNQSHESLIRWNPSTLALNHEVYLWSQPNDIKKLAITCVCVCVHAHICLRPRPGRSLTPSPQAHLMKEQNHKLPVIFEVRR